MGTLLLNVATFKEKLFQKKKEQCINNVSVPMFYWAVLKTTRQEQMFFQ